MTCIPLAASQPSAQQTCGHVKTGARKNVGVMAECVCDRCGVDVDCGVVADSQTRSTELSERRRVTLVIPLD